MGNTSDDDNKGVRSALPIKDAFQDGADIVASAEWDLSLYAHFNVSDPVLGPVFFSLMLLSGFVAAWRALVFRKEEIQTETIEGDEALKAEIARLQNQIDAQVAFLREKVGFEEERRLQIGLNELMEKNSALEADAEKNKHQIQENNKKIKEIQAQLQKTSSIIPAWFIKPADNALASPASLIPISNMRKRIEIGLILASSYAMGFWIIYMGSLAFGAVAFTTLVSFLWPLIFVAIAALGMYFYNKNRADKKARFLNAEVHQMQTLHLKLQKRQFYWHLNVLSKLSEQLKQKPFLGATPLTKSKPPQEGVMSSSERTKKIMEAKEQVKKGVHFYKKLNAGLAFINGFVTVLFAAWPVTTLLQVLGLVATTVASGGISLAILTAIVLCAALIIGGLKAYWRYHDLKTAGDALDDMTGHCYPAPSVIDENEREINDAKATLDAAHLKEVDLTAEPTPTEETHTQEITFWDKTKKIFFGTFLGFASFLTGIYLVRGTLVALATAALITSIAFIYSPPGLIIASTIGILYATTCFINYFYLAKEKVKTVNALATLVEEGERQQAILHGIEMQITLSKNEKRSAAEVPTHQESHTQNIFQRDTPAHEVSSEKDDVLDRPTVKSTKK